MNLPEHIINKIMLYVSHPVADMIRELQCEYHKLEEEILLYPECDPIPFYSMCLSLMLYKKILKKLTPNYGKLIC